MPPPADRPPRPLREHWPAAVLAVVAALVAVWSKHTLFPHLSWNRDEPVYLWHVELLREGRLTAPDGGHPDLFLPWLSAARDGSMFTQYTPGWPLTLLAAQVTTGSPATALPLGAALAVIGTYALAVELLGRRRIATLAGALLLASPILVIQGGVHLSYLFTLGLGLIFGTLVLSGLRRDRWPALVVAGVVLGWIFLTRPYDAVLWGAAFGVAGLALHRDRWRPTLTRLLVPVGSALPLVVLGLAYNRRITGGLLEFPITVADPLDTFGFGTKRLMPGFPTTDYDLGTALRATAKNAFFLPWFLVGSYVGLVAAALGLWFGRRSSATLVLLLVGAVFPVGYFVFWGNHLSSEAARISGPIYFIPLYAPICVLVATVLVRWWDARRPWALALAGLLAVGTVPVAVTRFDVNHRISEEQGPWRASVDDLDEPALVLVADTGRYLLYANPFSSNSPDLSDPVLYASHGAPSVLELIAAEPERALYVQRAHVAAPDLGPREDPQHLEVEVVPAEVLRAATPVLPVVARPPEGARVLHVAIDTGVTSTTWTEPVPEGPWRAEVTVGADGAPGDLNVTGAGRIVVTLGWGASTAEAETSPQVRAIFLHRVVDGVVEVLVPPLTERLFDLRDHEEWRHVPGIEELQVTATR